MNLWKTKIYNYFVRKDNKKMSETLSVSNFDITARIFNSTVLK